MIAIEGECDTHDYWGNVKNSDKYIDYLADVQRSVSAEERAAGHGGVDYIEFKEWFAAIREGREMPIDVYDAAAWMSITALSEASIAQGGAPQTVPDFTNGKWLIRKPLDATKLPEVK